MLFLEPKTRDETPRAFSESVASWLSRSTTSAAHTIRGNLSGRLGSIPEADEAKGLRARLLSGDEADFESAVWELGMHRAVNRLGHRATIHPKLASSQKTPDWRVETEAGSYLLEARCVGISPAIRAANARLGQILDSLNKVEATGFRFWLDIVQQGPTDVSTRQLRRELKGWVDSLDWAEIKTAWERDGGWEALPSKDWTARDWRLRFRVIPVRDPAEGSDGGRAVGMHGPAEASVIDGVTPVRASLEEKAHKYGELDEPFVIALNLCDMMFGDDAVVDALLGSQYASWDRKTGEFRSERRRNGFFQPGRHTRVSAVLYCRRFNALDPDSHPPTVWHNPFASLPLSPEFLPFHSFVPDHERGIFKEHDSDVWRDSLFGVTGPRDR